MPHLVLLYTADLEADVPMDTLCRELADAMLEQRDEPGKAVFPTGGTRVLAYPAAHSAVADGQGNYGFLYANLRMGAGRSKVVHQSVGKARSAVLARHTEAARARRAIGTRHDGSGWSRARAGGVSKDQYVWPLALAMSRRVCASWVPSIPLSSPSADHSRVTFSPASRICW